MTILTWQHCFIAISTSYHSSKSTTTHDYIGTWHDYSDLCGRQVTKSPGCGGRHVAKLVESTSLLYRWVRSRQVSSINEWGGDLSTWPSRHVSSSLIYKGGRLTGLFCKRALQKRLYSAKETCNFKEPTNRSHPTHLTHLSCRPSRQVDLYSDLSIQTCHRHLTVLDLTWRLHQLHINILNRLLHIAMGTDFWIDWTSRTSL